MPLSEVRTGIRRYAGAEVRSSSGKRSGGAAKFFALLQLPFSLAALGLVAALVLQGPDSLLSLHGLLSGSPAFSSIQTNRARAGAVPDRVFEAEPDLLAEPLADMEMDASPADFRPEADQPSSRNEAAAPSLVMPGTPAVSPSDTNTLTPRLEAALVLDPGRPSLKDFDRRWQQDRHAAVMDELSEHPPSIVEKIAVHRPRLMVISAHQGAPKALYAAAAGGEPRDYGAYLEKKLGEVGTIVVEVSAEEPSVIFATATRAVDWRFVFSEKANVLAVHVEGALSPTVTGVPRDVPLTIRSRAFGDRDAAGRVKQLDGSEPDDANAREIRANLARFTDMYDGLPMTIFEKHTLARVALVDEDNSNLR